ncbi:hypothetical protein LY76DRAFT_47978 [Colletotrichum caudatum]|nr:hypothetical protein LY76DRAFT_47978 [Colletotrichum caudatum]
MDMGLISKYSTARNAGQNLQRDVDLNLTRNVYNCAGEPIPTSAHLAVPPHASACSSSQSLPGRKRTKKESGTGNDSEDDEFGKANKRQNTGGTSEMPAAKFFACPYFKRDPVRHLKCFMRFKLKRVKDVKQHLYRKHSLPEHCCPLCWAAFGCRSDYDSHMRRRSCQAQEMPGEYGGFMTVDQKKAISKRTDGGLDEHGQWYNVWKVLFPDEDRPASPYLKSTELEELIPIVRWFWKKNSSDIVSDILSSPRMAVAPRATDNSPAGIGRVARIDEGGARLTETIDILLDRVEESIRSFGRSESPSPPSPVFAPSPLLSEAGTFNPMQARPAAPFYAPKIEGNGPQDGSSAPNQSAAEALSEMPEIDFWDQSVMFGLSSADLLGSCESPGSYECPRSFMPE